MKPTNEDLIRVVQQLVAFRRPGELPVYDRLVCEWATRQEVPEAPAIDREAASVWLNQDLTACGAERERSAMTVDDLVNGLRHMADDHECCRQTIELVIERLEHQDLYLRSAGCADTLEDARRRADKGIRAPNAKGEVSK